MDITFIAEIGKDFPNNDTFDVRDKLYEAIGKQVI